jgi:hypothetical protein
MRVAIPIVLTLAWFAGVPSAAGARGAAPLSFDLVKVADQDTPIPGYPDQEFSVFEFQTAIAHKGRLHFSALSFGPFPQLWGAFEWSESGLTTVVDSHEPGLGGTATSTFRVLVNDVSDSRTLVRTSDSNTDRMALYWVSGSDIQEVVDSDTLIPGSSDPFSILSTGRADGDDVVFLGVTPDDHVNIYRVHPEDGAITPLIDESTPFPTFLPHRPEAFFAGGFDNGLLAFRAAEDIGGGFVGVYVTDLDGNVTPIMESPQPAPNGTDTFNSLGGGLSDPSIHNGKVAFGAGDFITGYTAIIVADAITGDTTIIADSDMDLPGRPTGPGVSFGVVDPAIHGDDVAFIGVDFAFGAVLYLYRDGVIHDLLHVGDVLDGKAIKLMEHSVSGFDGTLLSVGVTFTDNSRALYVVRVIPAPSPALLALALPLYLAPRRRR